ncbi:MAG TPA: ABC transporter permease [Geminicoccaceae bacterium]|nr:ABC transporter permease [Geminicoccaceae bacterium]
MTADRPRPWALLTPAGAVLGGLFALPLAGLFVVSFWTVARFRLRPGLTLDNYGRALADYGDILLRTVAMGVAVGALTTALAAAFAYALRFRAGRFAEPLLFLTLLTVFGGYLVKIYAWKSILGSDGLVNGALVRLGVVEAPVEALLYSRTAVVVTLVNLLLPFAVLPVHAALRNVPEDCLDAARDLGASPFVTAWRVVLPQCRWGLFAAFAVAFLGAAGDYVTPLLLGGASGSMLGQFIALQFSARFNWPLGAAMSFTLFAACMAVVAAAYLTLAARRDRP